jgi:hypothetical protein
MATADNDEGAIDMPVESRANGHPSAPMNPTRLDEAEISPHACVIFRNRVRDSRREIAKRAEIMEILMRKGDL